MIKFLYALFRLEYPDEICLNCEFLKQQLVAERNRHDSLLNHLLETKEEVVEVRPAETLKPVGKSYIPFAVKRQMMEAEDRELQKLKNEKREELKDEIKELEEELGI